MNKILINLLLVHAVVLDFSKAFDRVPHKFLMENLFDTNIDIIKWVDKLF